MEWMNYQSNRNRYPLKMEMKKMLFTFEMGKLEHIDCWIHWARIIRSKGNFLLSLSAHYMNSIQNCCVLIFYLIFLYHYSYIPTHIFTSFNSLVYTEWNSIRVHLLYPKTLYWSSFVSRWSHMKDEIRNKIK